MRINKSISAFLITLCSIFLHLSGAACSMYKVTADGKTMVGCNEDAWRTTSRIWFENAQDKNQFGACFTGSRKVGNDKFAPQSGMNEAGLVFSRLAAYHPIEKLDQIDKKQVINEVQYLTDILHSCKTIYEVKNYIEKFDHSIFIDDVFIYVDRSGDYLVVEPYKLIEGSDPFYVLANFCPSLTSNQNARKQTKYRNGEDYLRGNNIETSLDFCRSVSDTMHVCRSRNGDGTLLTTIWDTQEMVVNLYFYHSYDTTTQFNLANELALGDHIISIPDLFPENAEFERLIDYKTPFNENSLRVSLVLIGGVLLLLSFLYMISFIRKKNEVKIGLIKLIFLSFNLLLFGYLIILTTNINIYYFDAPYQFYDSDVLSLSSYIPILLLLIIAPITFYTIRYVRANNYKMWIKGALVFNNIIYLVLVLGFGYWGFFDIFN